MKLKVFMWQVFHDRLQNWGGTQKKKLEGGRKVPGLWGG
jgi:hypothetical protein